jgi:hypothetical protein
MADIARLRQQLLQAERDAEESDRGFCADRMASSYDSVLITMNLVDARALEAKIAAANAEIKALKARTGEPKPHPQQAQVLSELQLKLDTVLLSEKRMRDKLALAEARADAGSFPCTLPL